MHRRLTVAVLKHTTPKYDILTKEIVFSDNEGVVIFTLSPDYIIGDYVTVMSPDEDRKLYSIKTKSVFNDLDMSSFKWFINTSLANIGLTIDGVPVSVDYCGLYWEDKGKLYINDKRIL